MKALFTLTPAESKRLIAKATAVLPEVQAKMQQGTIIIGAGTTNAFVLEELTGKPVDKARYTAGIIAEGRHCVTHPRDRLDPVVLTDGKPADISWQDATDKLSAKDIVIKGGNAIDSTGTVGVQVGDPNGGTIGKALPIIIARGATLILPIGLEKLIPDVNRAAAISGIQKYDYSAGMFVGLMPVSYGKPITEIEALKELANVEATCISAGGIGGNEGSVTLAIEGPEEQVKRGFALIKSILGEKPVPSLKKKCFECIAPCTYPSV